MTAKILQWLSARQFINQTCKPNSAIILRATRSCVVTAQFGGYLLSLCCSKQALSTTGQRSASHWVSLAINPPAFPPNSGFCASFNTKDYMTEIIVVDWRASAYFQGYVLCRSELSSRQPHPTGRFCMGISESWGMLGSVLALAGLAPCW